MGQALKATAGEQARHVCVAMPSAQSATIIYQAVLEECCAVWIERVFGGAELVDETGVQLHPLFGALEVEFMQRNIGTVVGKRVRG